MAKKMHPCETFTIEELPSVGMKFVNDVVLPVTLEQTWEMLEDAEAWPAWAGVIQKVEWTSPKPFGLGTTRMVYMTGIVGDEEFIAWEPLKQMSFCFTSCSNKDTLKFGENWECEKVDDNNTRVQWTVVMENRSGIGKMFLKLLAPILNWQFGKYLKNFQKYADNRYNK